MKEIERQGSNGQVMGIAELIELELGGPEGLSTDSTGAEALEQLVECWGLEYLLVHAFLKRDGKLPDNLTLHGALLEANESGLEAVLQSQFQSTVFGERKRIVIDSKVCVDVTHTCSHGGNSGIQRVVRGIAADLDSRGCVFFKVVDSRILILSEEERLNLTNWTDDTVREPRMPFEQELTFKQRIYESSPPMVKPLIRWGYRLKCGIVEFLRTGEIAASPKAKSEDKSEEIHHSVVFRNCRLILPELPDPLRVNVYRSVLAQFNHSLAILYDLIPITHPEYCVTDFTGSHVSYLKLLSQHFDKVVGISEDAAETFRRYSNLFTSSRPSVSGLLLPNLLRQSKPDRIAPRAGRVPEFVMVSTIDPRKNHMSVLLACEKLWSRGLEFKLRFIGGPGWKSEHIHAKIDELKSLGREMIYSRDYISDTEMVQIVSNATATLFPSEIEGFGLPVLESLALGTPVVCSDHGSVREIADLYGGCVVLRYSDVDALSEAIESFIVNPLKGDKLVEDFDLRRGMTVSEYVEAIL